MARFEVYILLFNKKNSFDNSGKANLVYTGKTNDIVWGVIFEIEESQKENLDLAEGNGYGYNRHRIKVTDTKGMTQDCEAYIATEAEYLDNSLIPMDWYKEHCITEAKEHNLPDYYVAFLENQTAMIEPDTNRAIKERKIYE